MSQGETFLKGEGDAFYQRNSAHLAAYVASDDPIARALSSLDIQPKRIVDFGCSSGERLRSLADHYRADAVGIDPSAEAIRLSRERGGSYGWVHGSMEAFEHERWMYFDLAICSMMLHWIDRSKLLQSLAVLESCLTPQGYVAIFDFQPIAPYKRPYRHQKGVWTFKADYPKMLEATGCFEAKYRKVLTYPDYQVPAQDYAGDLCAVTVLQRVTAERMLTA